jgi:hypothetical protein
VHRRSPRGRSLGALIFENSEVLDIIHGPRPAVVTAHGRASTPPGDAGRRRLPQAGTGQLKGKIFPAMGGIVTTAPLGDLASRSTPKTWPSTTAASCSITTA